MKRLSIEEAIPKEAISKEAISEEAILEEAEDKALHSKTVSMY